ncbi:MAG TPA: zinc-binding alcohol dehydrogenase family protein [Acidimicrobiia bacterium]|jgi:NADPH2:quinone reductase|nr:zinc-binding alcohol dehydrogenase family protein [Acidimicrobiia bacterium]
MKAAVYYETGKPEVLRYEDVPDPECGPGMVLVQVEAISIEGGDTLNRLGGEMPAVPHVVGYQCAGTIKEVGEGVTDRHVGQRVVATMFWGSHAELAAVPALITWPIPDGGDLIKCACVPVAFGTADDCLFEFGRLQAGETALIQAGASGVGVAAVQLAKRAGATVIATASSLERLERVRPLGLDHAVDYSHDGWVDEVRKLTDGRGVDVVVDSVGGHVLAGSIACLAYRGRCITVGSAGREEQLIDVRALGAGNQSITGVFLGAEMVNERTRMMIQRHVDDVAAGRLQVIVDRTFPLADAAAAHAFIESRQAVGRVVLIP